LKILVTGGSGFIGRHLCNFLSGEGHEVVATYHSPEELSSPQLPKGNVVWHRLDMQDDAAVQREVEGVRAAGVFHLAAQAYAQKAWSNPSDTFRTNVLGTISLFEALRKHPPKDGTLLTASGSAYGVPPKLPIQEDFPLNPTNPYGVSKACQEMLALQYSLNFQLRIVRARLFGTTGPGKTGDAMNDFARQIAAMEKTRKPGAIKVGNLDTRRDVSDIRDVIRAMWRIFEAGTPAEPVNVGAGESHPVREIAETLVRLAKVPIRLDVDPALLRPTDELDNRADITRLKALGYVRKLSLAQTIEDSLEFWRKARVKSS
jgi:GDP-4-dehydro-6-deoxy-D-mannose reductase